MASEIRVNQIQNRSGLSTVTFSDTGVVISGITTITDLRTTGGALIVGTGASVYSPATNVLALGTNNTERVRVTSTGRVGLGTNIPDSYDSGGRTLVVDESGSLAGMTIRSSTQGAVYFADGLTGNEAYRGRIEYSHSTDALNFGTAGTGSKLSITSGGNVQIANGNLVFSTSGTGIDFSAASGSAAGSTSAVLNDYEEGTWTPYWSDYYGTNLFVDNDITILHAFYRKINKMIIYSTYFYSDSSFSYNTAGGISGSTNANIGGLPFTSNGFHAGSVGYYANWNGYDSSGYGFNPMIISNSTTTTLRLQYPSTNSGVNIPASALASSNSVIIVSGVYYTS